MVTMTLCGLCLLEYILESIWLCLGCVAAITDPRPGYDCGKKKSFNFDYSYNTMTEVRLD